MSEDTERNPASPNAQISDEPRNNTSNTMSIEQPSSPVTIPMEQASPIVLVTSEQVMHPVSPISLAPTQAVATDIVDPVAVAIAEIDRETEKRHQSVARMYGRTIPSFTKEVPNRHPTLPATQGITMDKGKGTSETNTDPTQGCAPRRASTLTQDEATEETAKFLSGEIDDIQQRHLDLASNVARIESRLKEVNLPLSLYGAPYVGPSQEEFNRSKQKPSTKSQQEIDLWKKKYFTATEEEVLRDRENFYVATQHSCNVTRKDRAKQRKKDKKRAAKMALRPSKEISYMGSTYLEPPASQSSHSPQSTSTFSGQGSPVKRHSPENHVSFIEPLYKLHDEVFLSEEDSSVESDTYHSGNEDHSPRTTMDTHPADTRAFSERRTQMESPRGKGIVLPNHFYKLKARVWNGQATELNSWTLAVEDMLEMIGVDHNSYESFVAARFWLGSQSQDWLQSVRMEGQSFKNWTQLKGALQRQYLPGIVTVVGVQALAALKQTRSVTDYINQFRKLVMNCPPMWDIQTVGLFLAGLKPDIRVTVTAAQYTTLKKCCDHALAIETAQKQVFSDRPRQYSSGPYNRRSHRNEYYNDRNYHPRPPTDRNTQRRERSRPSSGWDQKPRLPTRHVDFSRDPPARNHAQLHQVNEMHRAISNSRNNGIQGYTFGTCYNCKQLGHRSKDCIEPLTPERARWMNEHLNTVRGEYKPGQILSRRDRR